MVLACCLLSRNKHVSVPLLFVGFIGVRNLFIEIYKVKCKDDHSVLKEFA